MKRVALLALASAFVFATSDAAHAQAPKLEKTRIALSVGGSISQMNKIAYFVALNRKYFEQEGLQVESTAFASGTAASRIQMRSLVTLTTVWSMPNANMPL